MKKRSLLILLVLSFVLAGSVSSLAAEETTITVALWTDDAMDETIAAFNEEYPDINVKVEATAIEDHHNALLTKIAANSEVPDVAFIEIAYIGQFANKGGFENLLADPYNADQFKDGIVSYAWAQAKTTDGKLVAVPTDIAPATVFYRRDKLAELGYDIEDMKTIEDWIKAGKKFAKDVDGDGQNDRWLIADAANIYKMYAKSGRGRFFDAEGNCIVDQSHFLKAFKMAKEVRDLGLDAQIGEWTNEWYATFKEGTTLMTPCGAWLGGHIKEWIAPDTAGQWGATSLPDGLLASWGGTFAGIPEDAEHKEAAWKFIKFLTTSPEAQLTIFKIQDSFPALTETYNDPMFNESVEFYAGQKVRKLWADTAKQIPDVLTYKYDVIARDVVNNALTQVLEGDVDPETALRLAKVQIERRISRLD